MPDELYFSTKHMPELLDDLDRSVMLCEQLRTEIAKLQLIGDPGNQSVYQELARKADSLKDFFSGSAGAFKQVAEDIEKAEKKMIETLQEGLEQERQFFSGF